MENIKTLAANVQASRDAWAAAMEKIIPIGSVVEVFIGQSSLEIEVTKFSTNSWHECSVYGVNTKTGAARKCHYVHIIGYEFSEYDRFGSLHWQSAQKKRAAAQAKQGGTNA